MVEARDTLVRSEFSRQADTMSRAAVFNDAAILDRIREAARLDSTSRALAELRHHLDAAGLRVETTGTWVNHREVGEWMKITNAPERIGPIKVVMTELARRGARAGIDLRVEDGRVLFEHKPALTVAVKV